MYLLTLLKKIDNSPSPPLDDYFLGGATYYELPEYKAINDLLPEISNWKGLLVIN
jgi:hypothetical protein